MSLWSKLKKHAAVETGQTSAGDDFGGKGEPERFCRGDMIRYSVGQHLQLVYSKFYRSQHLLPPDALSLLDHCSTFKTLDEHAQDYLDFAGPAGGEFELVRAQLAELARAKLLVPYGEMLDLCRHPDAGREAAAEITSVGVVTRDRASLLRNCAASYLENGRRYGRRYALAVTDDSASAAARDETRRMLRSLGESYDLEVLYGGLEEKTRYVDALTADGGLPREVVEFALFDTEGCGSTFGANRNALLLHTVGEMFLSADDDTVCRFATPPEPKPGLAFDAKGDFMDFWFFRDREEALRSASFVENDALSIHEQLLGRSLGSCVADFAREPGALFSRVNSRQVRDLQSGGGKVLATFTGLVGDSAMPAPASCLALRGDSRARLTRSRAAYISALTSREVLRVTERPYISANAWCVTTLLGLDNRALLPPFMPVLRGEDDVFGFTLDSCFDHGYFGYLPWAVLHAPPERRSYSSGGIIEFASRVRTCNLILACVTSADLWPGRGAEVERLRALGNHLMAVGAMAQPDFEEFVRAHLLRMGSDFVTLLEAYLEEFDASPDFWADDMAHYIDTLREALTREDYVTPTDLLDGRSPEEARRLARRLVFKFGQLLYWWPAIIQAAKSLRAQGRRLAQRA